jgi:GNAT superfamily N-acetyltransferase
VRLSARAATTHDGEILSALLGSATRAASSERGGEAFLALDLPAIERYLEAPDAIGFIGAIDDVPLGLALATLRHPTGEGRPVAHVDLLWVDPPARDVGLGETMLGHVESWGKEQGASAIDAVVLPGVREAKNFLETSGFVARLIVMHRVIADEQA